MTRLSRIGAGFVLVVVAMLALSASAGAVVLGSTTFVGTGPNCDNTTGITQEFIQSGTDSTYDYAVPTGGGAITSWSFNATGATPGTPYGLIVVRPSGGSFTVVGSDNETVPSSPSGVQTYTLATPIQVQAGDLIGDLLTPGSNAYCFSEDGPLTAADTDTYAVGSPTVGSSPVIEVPTTARQLVNISVNLVQSQDVGIAQSVTQSSINTGATTAFLLSVTSAGAVNEPITVTDAVPSGLKIDSVAAGPSTCTITGQHVSCTGVSAPSTIAVIVTATQTGTYSNAASVSTTLADPNTVNNTSSATLQVTPLPVSSQVSPAESVASIKWRSLAKLPLSEAKTVIRALGCKVGKITLKHSSLVHKGEVISTSARARENVAIGSTITIVASSGKPAAKHKNNK